MIHYVFEAQRESGALVEWSVEAKGDMFRKTKEVLAQEVLKTINKANHLFWNKYISCKFIRIDIR